jgi:predicted outer membrane repeat protein
MGGVKTFIGRFGCFRNNMGSNWGDNLLIFGLILIGLMVIFSYGMGNVSAASSDSIYVNSSSGNDAYNGLNPAWTSGLNGPKATIKNAISTVTTDGTVHIANGTYNESNIQINTNMKIIGENQDNTIINGKQSGNNIFTIATGINLTIINLTLTNATTNTGAIYNNGILTVNNSTFTGNLGSNGGAIYNEGTLTVNNSSFTENEAVQNGAVILNHGTLTVDNSTFTGNLGSNGGAIFNYGGILTVNNSTFTGNLAVQNGGAIYNTGTLTVNNSTFTGNHAVTGGAIFNCDTVVVNFNRIIGNIARDGSAIYNYSGTVDARYNWWGSNTNPSAYISGSGMTYDPWIVLTVTSNPTTLNVDGKSTITIDLLHDSDKIYHDPVNGHVPDGLNVNLSCDTKGTVNPIISTITNGSTTTTFTGLQPGVSQILTNVDAQTETTNVNIITSTNIIVNPISGFKGDKINLTANLNDTHGNVPVSGKTVRFSVNGNVVGITVTDSNGIATLPYTIQENSGIYTILAEFTGDTTYTASSNTNTLTVTSTPTAIVVNPISGYKGEVANLTANLTDTHGNVPVSGKTVRFSVNGNVVGTNVTDSNGIATLPYTIQENSGIYTILAEFTGDTTYATSSNTNTINVTNMPTVIASPNGGLYKTAKSVTLTMNEPGNIYYTINGTTPTNTSNLYKGPLTIKSTTTLKFLAVDLAGNKSPVYTKKYTIDKTAPKVISTKPKNHSRGVSLTTVIILKFNEKISKTTKFSKIHIKNLTTGKFTHTTTKLSGNTITIKMIRSRLSHNHYQVIIPTSAVKDKAGNTNKKCLINFKTRRY